jgi:anti-sigma regulatory factor (Ser/Thr protein kinase)
MTSVPLLLRRSDVFRGDRGGVTRQDAGQQRFEALFPATLDAGRRARRAIGEISALRRYPHLRFPAEVLTAELATNVTRHAGLDKDESFRLEAEWNEQTLRVWVIDGGLGFNPLAALAAHRTSASTHRGIALLDALADRWGYLRSPDSCHLWFELDLIPGRRAWSGRVAIKQ